MKKLLINGLIAAIAVASVAIFDGCKKHDEVLTTEQDNVKVQKFDPNAIAISDLVAQPYFNDYANACIDFLQVVPDFTQWETDRMNELLDLIQRAIDIGDYDLIQQYIDEYLRIFYRTDDSNYGRKKVEDFSNATLLFIDKMTADFPVFKELSKEQQVEVLSVAFSNINFPNPHSGTTIILPGVPVLPEPDMVQYGAAYAVCASDANSVRSRDLAVATAGYVVGLAGCVAATGPFAGLCVVGVMALYGYAYNAAETQYNTSLELCRALYG